MDDVRRMTRPQPQPCGVCGNTGCAGSGGRKYCTTADANYEIALGELVGPIRDRWDLLIGESQIDNVKESAPVLLGEKLMDNVRRMRRPRRCGVCGNTGCAGRGGRKYCPGTTTDTKYNVILGTLVGARRRRDRWDLLVRDDVPRKKRPRRCGVCGITGCAGNGGQKYCPVSKSKDGAPQQKKIKVYTRQCSVCSMYGPYGLNCGRGSGNRKLCLNFYLNGESKQKEL